MFFSEHCRLEISSIFHQEHLISCESWWDFPPDVIMTGSTGRVVTFVSNIPVRAGKFLSPFRGGTPLHAMCAQHMQLGASAVVQLLCRLRVPLEGRLFFLAKLG